MASPAEPPFMDLRVTRKSLLAQDVWWFELRHPDGEPLPPFTAGAHLTVQLPDGVRRNYSLCSDPADTGRYEIAVKRDARGRGGSIRMADDVTEGAALPISVPRNNFELAGRAREFLFIAGGIGITPILSMMRQLRRTGAAPFRLIYCTRDSSATAFGDVLATEFSGQVEIHHDHGDIDQGYDFWPLFETPGNAHVYCCGPRGLMDAVADMSGHWPSGSIHFESFGVDASAWATNEAFSVRLQRSGDTMVVAADQSILEALRAGGHPVLSSCESGTCGSCRTGLISGDVEHRDMVLSDDEKSTSIMVCVSRARGGELVLDL
ncbi:MAG: PDR/VanB family oxidoreductase [Betaproteobacteria bacterium]